MPLPFVDTSRFKDGMGRCLRLRYLQYHFDGFGISRNWNQVPTVGGIIGHRINEQILLLAREQPLYSQDQVRHVINTEADLYEEFAKGVAIANVEPEQNEEERLWTVAEQKALLEGLGWLFVRVLLPYILEHYEVLAVEPEYLLVIGCSCGLGDGPITLEQALAPDEAHAARDCQGCFLQGKPDVVLVPKVGPRRVIVLDYKFTGWSDAKTWRDGFERNVQFALHTATVEANLGEEVEQILVIGIQKGKWQRSYDPATQSQSGPKRQASWLCYAYYRPGNPPWTEEDWKLSFYYQDEDGKRRQANKGKGYDKVPTWEAFQEQEGVRPMEQWVATRTDEELGSLIQLVGPIDVPRYLVKRTIRAVAASEQRIIAPGLWLLEETQKRLEAEGKVAWPQPEFQAALDMAFPQSWECKRWNQLCPMVPICFMEPGWETPYEGDRYRMRRPHHKPELTWMKSLGFDPPAEVGRDDD